MTGFDAFTALLRRDFLLAYRIRAELANPLLFFVLVISLFPLGISPSSSVLQTLAPVIVWVAALFAAMLSLDGMFRSDFEDGSLELLLVSNHSTALLILAKIIAHWLTTGLPLVLLAPLLAKLLFLPNGAILPLLATLLLGTPVLSLIGSIGVALTIGLRRGGILLTLLIMPLYIPVLIFATSAVHAAADGLPINGQLAILAAMLLLALTLAPFATAAALRISMN